MSDDDSPVREAIAAIVAAQRSIAHSMFQTSIPDWIQLDLTMGQLRTLMALAADGPMTVSALAETLAISKPTASILIDRLVQAGDADRSEDKGDRRRTQVALTPAGAALVARLRQGQSDRYERWLAAMRPDDLAALTQGMQALAAIAERGDLSGVAKSDSEEHHHRGDIHHSAPRRAAPT
jgi:MarR family transcriptional regulator, organic hydroperoxide resistance regulator